MKTKAKIVEKLLDKKYITTEEAVVLLTSEKKYIRDVIYGHPEHNPTIPSLGVSPYRQPPTTDPLIPYIPTICETDNSSKVTGTTSGDNFVITTFKTGG